MPIPRQQPPRHDRYDGTSPSASFPRSRAALLTPAEAAAALHVDANTLARWSKAGKLAAVRTPGGHRRYLAAEIDRLGRFPDQPREERSDSA